MVLVQYQLALRDSPRTGSTEAATLDLPVHPSTSLADVADAVKAKHGLADFRIYGPQSKPCHELGDLQLYQYSYSCYKDVHACPDKFYVLSGGLYRRRPYGSEWGPLPSSKQLAPLLEYNALAAGSSTAGLQAQPLQVHGSTELTDCYFIKTQSQKSYAVMANPSMTVWELKLLIQEQEGTPVHLQRLMMEKGRQLEDGSTLQDYGLLEGEVLHLVRRLLGGMFHPTSGRQDNKELDGRPKQKMMQVTVVVPGHGDVGLAVDICKVVKGGELLNMALQAAAKQKGVRVSLPKLRRKN